MDNSVYCDVFKALSDETRVKICKIIARDEICGCKILEQLHITQPTLSYHMKLLCTSGIAKSRKEGTLTMYSINEPCLKDLKNFIIHLNSS